MIRPHNYIAFLIALLVLVPCLLTTPAQAITVQDMVTGGVTPLSLQSTLQGQNVTISNMTVINNGCNVTPAVGLFSQGTIATGAGPVLGDSNGVVLATGVINGADPLVSPNNFFNWTNTLCAGAISDPDMLVLEPFTQWGEYVGIEFDVTPSKPIMAIPFQFASDEFPEYVCTSFNDAVGIFVSGPGIAGPYTLGAENFAKTPAGDLTSINWVNTGSVGLYGTLGQCGSLANIAYYTDNSSGNTMGGNTTVATTNANLEMDGWTNYIYQPISVTPGSTYHVKAIVADAGDRLWDSAVFFHLIFSTSSFSGFDFGDAPDSYRTLTSNAGPTHGIDSTLYLGLTMPDNEVTGTPSVAANADDITGIPDDEDGVAAFPPLISSATSYSVPVVVNNTSGTAARLTAWIDFNGNGQFDIAEGISINVPTGSINTPFTLNWTGLSGIVAGTSYARLRLTTSTTITTASPGGNAPDGEVEDYVLPILSNPDFGDAPNSYLTLLASGGPVHGISPTIFLGSLGADTEADGLPTATANGDDLAGTDDEDGITTFNTLSTGSTTYTVNVRVNNTTGASANLIGWIDFNRNGTFEATEAATAVVATGTINGNIALNWTGLTGLVAGQSYIRLRFSTDVAMSAATPGGAVIDGEVEDYPITIVAAPDFGDAPDSYLTLSASGGPNHAIDGNIFMGFIPPDADADGQPSVNADGDDLTGTADEDGVISFPALTLASSSYSIDIYVTNNTGSPATLVGWIDFNGNGIFDITEGTSTTVASGTTSGIAKLNWIGLAGLTASNVYARIRFSTGALTTSTPGGAMADGEVEDYPLTIFNSLGQACITAGSTAHYPWDGNFNDAGGLYNLQAGTATFNTQDYISSQAAVFDGATNLLQYSINNGTRFMTNAFLNMSMMVWVKPASLAGVQTIYEEGGDDRSRNRRRGIILRLNGSNLEALMRDQGGAAQTLSAPYPTDNKWHFIGFTYANGNATLYIDGASVGTLATGLGNIRRHRDPGAFGASNARDILGNNVTNNYYTGLMDEAAYYYLVLTAANISSTYNCMKPSYDFGDAPVGYGASEHRMVSALYLGDFIDGDSGNWGDGVDASGNASDDDTVGDPAGGIDDEDGAPDAASIGNAATTFSVDVYATNQTGFSATLLGWLDINQNGTFEASESATATVTSGSVLSLTTLNWSGLTGPTSGNVYLRLRLTTDAAVTTASPSGSAIDGETEDYLLTVQQGLPSLMVVKSSNVATAAPGAVITYTVTTTNTGSGGAFNVTAKDRLSGYTSLATNPWGNGTPIQFTEGTNPSGLTIGSILYSNDGGSTFTYPLNMSLPYDSYVTNFKVIMGGTMNANQLAAPSFTLQYQAQVK